MSVHVSLLLLHYFLFWGNVLVRFSQLHMLFFFLKYPGATKVTFCQQPGQNLSAYTMPVPERLHQRNLLQTWESVNLSVGLNNQNSVG